jgi:hypothetical protein
VVVVSHAELESGAWWANDPAEKARLMSEYLRRKNPEDVSNLWAPKPQESPEPQTLAQKVNRIADMALRGPSEGPTRPLGSTESGDTTQIQQMTRLETPEVDETPAGERHARRFSESKGMPTHRPDRPSRSPEARRKRFLLAVMRRDNVTWDEAEALHPSKKGTKAIP